MSDTSRSASARLLPPLVARRSRLRRLPSANRHRRVHVVTSRRAKHMRLAKRTRAPAFATRGGMTLTSAESRMTTANPELALARRFRGFIDPMPISQNAFEALRKPHVVALNLEPPVALPQEAAPIVAEAPAQPPAPAPVVATKQDRIAPQPAARAAPTMELASAESRRVTLPDPAPAQARTRRGRERCARAASLLQRGCATA